MKNTLQLRPLTAVWTPHAGASGAGTDRSENLSLVIDSVVITTQRCPHALSIRANTPVES